MEEPAAILTDQVLPAPDDLTDAEVEALLEPTKPKVRRVSLEHLWHAVREPDPDPETRQLILDALLWNFGTDIMLWCQNRTYNAIRRKGWDHCLKDAELFIAGYNGNVAQLAALVGRTIGYDLYDFDKPLQQVMHSLEHHMPALDLRPGRLSPHKPKRNTGKKPEKE